LLILGRALSIECESCQAEREDKEGRQDQGRVKVVNLACGMRRCR
jgi:hypothetical protein